MSIPNKVHVIIDTLALAGFDPRQRNAIAAALQTELARRFAQVENLAALDTSHSLATLKAQPFTLPAAASPRQIAAQSSQQLVRSLTGASAIIARSR